MGEGRRSRLARGRGFPNKKKCSQIYVVNASRFPLSLVTHIIRWAEGTVSFPAEALPGPVTHPHPGFSRKKSSKIRKEENKRREKGRSKVWPTVVRLISRSGFGSCTSFVPAPIRLLETWEPPCTRLFCQCDQAVSERRRLPKNPTFLVSSHPRRQSGAPPSSSPFTPVVDLHFSFPH